jgi:phosphoribosylamine--glycine ligase
MASEGYPEKPKTGKALSGLAEAAKVPEIVIFHSATRQEGSVYYTSGGRVLGVGAYGRDLGQARTLCYDSASKISFDGAHYRKDIAKADRVAVPVGGKKANA